MTEEWRRVVGYEDAYEVSSLGRVRGPRGLKALTLGSNGYFHVSFCHLGRKAFPTVHSLVAQAFIGNRPAKHDVAHDNGDRGDNRLANLRYATRLENEADKRRHGRVRRGSDRPNASLSEDQVAAIKTASGLNVDIARRFGISDRLVGSIKRGETWDHVVAATVRADPKARRRGEQSPHAKLDEVTVRAIRSADGTLREIAARFGTSLQNVATIRSRRSWKHIA